VIYGYAYGGYLMATMTPLQMLRMMMMDTMPGAADLAAKYEAKAEDLGVPGIWTGPARD
jgi:hypothetical protein